MVYAQSIEYPADISEPPIEVTQLLCLRVTTEAGPGALPRVLANFQHLNLVPRRVVAECGSEETIQIRVDLAGIGEHRLDVLTAKLGQIPTVLHAYWHRL